MYVDRPSVALLSLATAVPAYRQDQESVGRWMVEALDARPPLARWLRRLYDLSGIDERYACLPDFLEPPGQSRFSPGRAAPEAPSTAERMAIYQREATALGALAAERALADLGSASVAAVAASVTHLIVVSCTGFFAPGLDQAIARRLGLRPNVARTLVGFMGCAAAFNGLRLAQQIVMAQPDARVLVVCVELCSLHIQPGEERINLVVTSLFSDGAAACLVGAPPEHGAHFLLGDLYTELVENTADEMVWQIGDHGFTLHLSPDIPERLNMAAPRVLDALFGADRRPQLWAIHPGGPAIVERLRTLFSLHDADVAASRDVLRRYGNMSSPTILFVLENLRARLREAGDMVEQEGVAMAFGPGLVVEMARIIYVPDAHRLLQTAEAAEERVYVA